MLGFGSYRTAWFMAHRIREGMREAHICRPARRRGKVVEADETYVGGKEANKHAASATGAGGAGQGAGLSLVERDGRVRSHHVADVTAARPCGRSSSSAVERDSHCMTDEARLYCQHRRTFAGHGTVNHSAEEYVRGDVHTNTVEDFFSILKRGISAPITMSARSICSAISLSSISVTTTDRRLAIDDATRADARVKGIAGKRLTYRYPSRQTA